MTNGAAVELAREVADAHGAASLAVADQIAVWFSSGGLAFATKGQPDALVSVEARLSPTRQHVTLTGDSPRPWTLSVGDSGELKSRLVALRSGSHRLRWQPEDLGAFAAAALWTYLTLPLLLHRAERVDRPPDAGGVRRLRIRLPRTIVGHSSVQTLHIGPDGLIRRHDYTATTFGPWARATQAITSYETFDGVPVGTTRRVTPRLGRPLPFPTLVWIKIHHVQLARR
ncbi:MAG: hypothetical protein WD080_00610 [Egibacteraceae bacterium]